ncbi:hypothetical protein [Hymenobacter arizonensis]|uniref:Uncharacterized protein n=1 Tax=Hymenobacter arizonensis TaxID=1227077 RepID=A0A1I6BK70_HYMAR|nr:hypothetical protein [Hymenobacter arizonensis]SFQ81304.1 hypothetical protein SAMN04515668_4645 [Hymenobacter arizonensis]
MEYPEAVQRLLNHANLPSAGVPETEGLLQALAREPVPGPAVARQLADVVACYEALNRHLNGPVPSERSWASKAAAPLDRALAYAVSTLFCGCWQHLGPGPAAELVEPAAYAARRAVAHTVELGWNFVLASDYDSIAQEISYYYSWE